MKARAEVNFIFVDKTGVGEKRTELRIPLMARVDLLWDDGLGNPRIAPATLEDRSYGGISVRVKEPIGAGSPVTVRWGSEQVSGFVTNCRRDKSNFVIGVRREIGEDIE